MTLPPATPGPATSDEEEERQPGPVCAPPPPLSPTAWKKKAVYRRQ